MKKGLIVILLIALVFTFVACNGEMMGENGSNDVFAPLGGDGDPSPYSSVSGVEGLVHKNKAIVGDVDAIASGDRYDIYDEETGVWEEDVEREVSAGQITAKAWNDNEYYSQWKALFAEATDNDPKGKFFDYTEGRWAKDTAQRVKITVKEGEKSVFGATVEYVNSRQTGLTARTDMAGVAYLFPQEEEGTVTVKSGESEQTVSFTKEARDLTVDLAESAERANVIKLMFVIDATGSMGDEMDYIAAELTDVVHRVTAQATGVKIDLALLFYRDDGDEEKFAYHDFVTVSEDNGLQAQVKVIKAQRATGGGDFPEAMDEALLMGAEKNWGTENSTNLMVLVLDAPPHGDEEKCMRTFKAIDTAAQKGIRICPVLCSGADVFCEYVTRLASLLTGGTSIFVTDDSGIGGEHLDPELPDATVEKLNDLLVRLIVGYHTGNFGTPVPWNQDAIQKGQEQA